MIERLEVMTKGGQWVVLCEWEAGDSDYDAQGWLEEFGDRIGRKDAPLPIPGMIDLRQFAGVRRGT